MKYMGSKRAMLTNGLGTLLTQAVEGRHRFVDLFSGSAVVAKYVASQFSIPVHATDLQQYAVTLGAAVLHRTKTVDTTAVWREWIRRANRMICAEDDLLRLSEVLNVPYFDGGNHTLYRAVVATVRHAASLVPDSFSLTKAYGGFYFGLSQAIWLDALRATVPDGPLRDVAIAALIEAGSECSASPGHTAQPFAPTSTGLKHLLGAWARDLCGRVRLRFSEIAAQHALCTGAALVADAVEYTKQLVATDLVFIDPPYSEVQYSRFYHVLESIATGSVGSVFGVGRYPAIQLRPQSNFSRKRPAIAEFDRLMLGVAAAGATALVTFPEGQASNGLSGEIVEEISERYFRVARRAVRSTFSTLGGNGANRNARQGTTELILYLGPR